MDVNGDDKDSDEAKEKDGVNEDGDGTGLHVDELHNSVISRKLKQNAGAKNYEQYNSY